MVPTLPISGLTSRLSAPARLFASRLLPRLRLEAPVPAAETVLRAPQEAPAADSRSGWLHVPVKANSDEQQAADDVLSTYVAMSEADRWSEFLGHLATADRGCKVAPGGRRLARLISAGARAGLTAALAEQDWASAEALIDRLESALAPHGENPAAAHLLAQAHLDLGWALRNAGIDTTGKRTEWKAFLQRTARADAILDAFDPIEEMSPLLAGTRYLLVRGIEDGEDLFQDWYEDWCDLDPTDCEPHSLHAVHLLPQWFGTMAGFDAAARAAMARTQDQSGAATYTVYHLAAYEAMGTLSTRIDLPLFLTGLMDHFDATGCQERANTVAAVLTELHHSFTLEGPEKTKALALIRQTLAEHLRENLTEFHLSAWENGMSCITYALEQVFAEELADGAHLYAGTEGIFARKPDGLQPPLA